MQRNLIIAPSWLGDLIMSQSLYMVLKNQDPESVIDVYAPAYTLPILERMREIDHRIINPFAHGSLKLGQRFSEGRKLRSRYDRAFVLPNSLKSALVPWFAGIKIRIGFKGESRYGLINRIRTNKQDFPRMVERYVALAYDRDAVRTAKDLPPFPYPKLTVLPPDTALLSRLKVSLSRPLLALGCGANYGPSKLWPVGYFAFVCDRWIEQGGAVLALGSEKDRTTVLEILHKTAAANRKYFYDVAGQTSLTEALDLAGSCTAAVCNDSGMMHTVAAAGVPQVDIFGSTSTGYTPPLSSQALCLESTQPCHPCFARTCKYSTYACLREIRPEQVVAGLERLLSGKAV